MKRIFLVVAAVAVVAAMLAFSGLAGAKPGKGKQDLVDGGGTTSGGVEVSYENVRSDPNGKNAKGHFEIRTGSFFAKGKVTCLRVKGDRAVLAGKVTESSDDDQFPFGTFESAVEDNGSPEGGTPDRFDVTVTLSDDPVPAPECSSPREPSGELDDGDIKVRDAK